MRSVQVFRPADLKKILFEKRESFRLDQLLKIGFFNVFRVIVQKAVDSGHIVTLLHQSFTEMRADEPGGAGYDHFHFLELDLCSASKYTAGTRQGFPSEFIGK